MTKNNITQNNGNKFYIFVCILLLIFSNTIYPNNCKASKIKQVYYKKSLNNYLEKRKNANELLTAARIELSNFDSIPLSFDKKSCGNIKSKFITKLIKVLIRKANKINKVDLQSNIILSELNSSYCRKTIRINLDKNDFNIQRKIWEKIILFNDGLKYLEKASDYIKQNIEEHQDSLSYNKFIEIKINEAELHVYAGCIFLMTPIGITDTLEGMATAIKEMNEERAVDVINTEIKNLNNSKTYLSLFDSEYIDNFNKIDNKINELNLLVTNKEKQIIIGKQALNL